jgi:hypothetical protein
MKRLFALVGAAALAFMVQPAGATQGGGPSDPRAEYHGPNANATTCSDVDVSAQHHFGIEGAIGGSDGYVTATVSDGADNPDAVLDITTAPGVEVKAVVVKGGNGYNLYSSVVPGMIAPLNVGDKVPTISHWFVCYDLKETPKTGSVTVTKVDTGALAPAAGTYDVELRDATGASLGAQSVAAGHSVTWPDLPFGTYTLHETTAGSFNAHWWPSSTVVVDAEHREHSVTLTNDYGSGSITLTKTVEGQAPADAEFSFVLVADDVAEQSTVDAVSAASVDVRVLRAGESTTWEGLSAGRYRIIELTGGDFTTTWSPSDIVDIDGDHRHVEVLATNDFGEIYTGYVKVTKLVTGGLAPEGVSYQVRLESDEGEGGWVEIGSRSVTAGSTVAWFGLPHGTYRVVELSEGAFTTSWSPSDLIVLDDLHESARLTVTNDYGDPAPTGSVTVRKLSTGSLAPADASFTMTLVRVTDEGTTTVGVATMRSGEEYTWSDLPYGAYRIVESPVGGATTSYNPSSEVTVGAESQAVTVLVTNAFGDPSFVEPTTTTAPTTTTTQAPTTTTEAPTTTAAPTTTSASGVSNEQLAFTGDNTIVVAAIGLAIAALGVALVTFGRRRGRAA